MFSIFFIDDQSKIMIRHSYTCKFHKYSMLQMMHVSGHKTEKTFRDYIKLSSDEITDKIDAIVNGTRSEVF